MKLVLLTIAMALLSSHALASSAPASAESCVLVEANSANTAFAPATGVTSDHQYSIVQKIVRGSVSFELQEGHGQSRLVALKNGKELAATFGSRSYELNLDAAGQEVSCFGLNGQTE